MHLLEVLHQLTPTNTIPSHHKRFPFQTLFEEVYKATTEQLDWNNPEGQQYPHDLRNPLPLIPNSRGRHVIPFDHLINNDLEESARDVYSKRRIIVVTKLEIVNWHNYKHLDWITVRKDDDKLYKFKEGDFNRLHVQDIKDMLLLLVQGKLTNLTVKERLAFNVSLRMFTRSVVIQRRVKDLQLGVESYQKKLNLTKPNTDGTLNDVRDALNDHLKGIQIEYLPQTIWRQSDKDKAGAMIQVKPYTTAGTKVNAAGLQLLEELLLGSQNSHTRGVQDPTNFASQDKDYKSFKAQSDPVNKEIHVVSEHQRDLTLIDKRIKTDIPQISCHVCNRFFSSSMMMRNFFHDDAILNGSEQMGNKRSESPKEGCVLTWFYSIHTDRTDVFLAWFGCQIDLEAAIQDKVSKNPITVLDALGASGQNEDANHKMFEVPSSCVGSLARQWNEEVDGQEWDGKNDVEFDKRKVECFFCHNTGHFARECKFKCWLGYFCSIMETVHSIHGHPMLPARFYSQSRVLMVYPITLMCDFTPREQEDIDVYSDILLKGNHVLCVEVLGQLDKNCDYYEKKMAREAALNRKRVVHTNDRQATPAWNNTNRVNKANQFTPRPVNVRSNLSTASNTFKTGRVNVNAGHGNVNSGSVHVNAGTQLRVYTGKRYINTGCVHINTARVNRPISNKSSPKPSTVKDQSLKSISEHRGSKGMSSVVLLKVPRQHNMYTFDMKNVDSSKGYTCLLAKASSNEAKLWHRRLKSPCVSSTSRKSSCVMIHNATKEESLLKEGHLYSNIQKMSILVAHYVEEVFFDDVDDEMPEIRIMIISEMVFLNKLLMIMMGLLLISTISLMRNKYGCERSVVRIQRRLVALGNKTEEGIDMMRFLHPVERIRRLQVVVWAFASCMGFIVYQWMSRSAFLYGTIDDSPLDLEAYSLDSVYGGSNLERGNPNRYYLELERILQAQLGHEKGHASCHLLIGCRLVHNQVGFLFKPAESAGYTEIVDFLRSSKLRYALTHNPPIYDSLVKQFWQTATARTLADGTQQLNATIDSIEYTITEESVRRQLQLADASGINMLQNEEIFAGLQNIGSKSGGWDQFGSNIATALICLSTGRDFNFSKLIFDGMISNLKSKSKFLMYPRFLQMILNIQTENKNLFVPVLLTKKIFGNMKRSFQGIHRPLLPAMLTIDAGQPQPSAAPTPSQPVPTPTPSHVQIPTPPITSTPPSTQPPPLTQTVQSTPTLTQPVQSTTPPPQPSSVQLTSSPPPIQPVQPTPPITFSSPPITTIPDTQPTHPPSPQIPSPPYNDTEGPSFEPSYHMSPPPSHEPEIQTSRTSEESEQLRNLLDLVPRLESRVESLEKELSDTKQTLGTAVLQLIKKIKKLENKLRQKRKREDAEGQDQDIPSQTDQGNKFATPEKSKDSGEAQADQISPSTLEAAQILTNVASEGFKGSQAPLGSKIYRRKPKSTPTPTKILDFEEPAETQVNTGSTPSAQVNTGEVNTASEVNTGSIKLNTVIEQDSTAGEDKGQREGKAPML
ncbi:RNA-directed DNA polymerase, eukaryota, partial [Tanacetum coccineum]